MGIEWTKHADGYVCGDVGIFPGHFGSWEVWEKRDGEWAEAWPAKSLSGPFPSVFKSQEEAKAAAEQYISTLPRP